jgi:uncharacterized protein (DUF2237 family)
VEAYRAGKAPLIQLEATSEKMLDYVDEAVLLQFAYRA